MKANEEYIQAATEERPDIDEKNAKDLIPLEIVLLAMDKLRNDSVNN